jgi:hypothetical protein
MVDLGSDCDGRRRAFVKVAQIETLKQSGIVALFNHQREKEYQGVERDRIARKEDQRHQEGR